MGRKIRHHRGKRRPKRYFGRYTLAELFMAALGLSILVLVLVLVVSAIAG
jgi:hypothetical protein